MQNHSFLNRITDTGDGLSGGVGGNFYIKSKLEKKKQKMFFSVKNLNWEILTKILVTLQDGMGLRMKF